MNLSSCRGTSKMLSFRWKIFESFYSRLPISPTLPRSYPTVSERKWDCRAFCRNVRFWWPHSKKTPSTTIVREERAVERSFWFSCTNRSVGSRRGASTNSRNVNKGKDLSGREAGIVGSFSVVRTTPPTPFVPNVVRVAPKLRFRLLAKPAAAIHRCRILILLKWERRIFRRGLLWEACGRRLRFWTWPVVLQSGEPPCKRWLLKTGGKLKELARNCDPRCAGDGRACGTLSGRRLFPALCTTLLGCGLARVRTVRGLLRTSKLLCPILWRVSEARRLVDRESRTDESSIFLSCDPNLPSIEGGICNCECSIKTLTHKRSFQFQGSCYSKIILNIQTQKLTSIYLYQRWTILRTRDPKRTRTERSSHLWGLPATKDCRANANLCETSAPCACRGP